MMILQNTRSIGLIIWLVVLLFLFNAAVAFVAAFTEDVVEIPDNLTDPRTYGILVGVGSLVVASVYGVSAHRIMTVKMSKLEIIRSYLMTVGLCTALGGAFLGPAIYLYTDSSGLGFHIAVTTVVMGIIVALISTYLTSGKKGPLMKVIWFVIVVSLVMLVIESVLPAGSWWEFVRHVAHLMIAFFMLLLITDSGVRKELGVSS